MLNYFFHRILLMIPTLFGVMLLNFIIIQIAPGGPIQQVISKIRGQASDMEMRFGAGDGLSQMGASDNTSDDYSGSEGIDPELIKTLEKQFGFDKPLHERFFLMMKNYITFDFGKSYFREKKVSELLLQKLPISISLGIWTMLLIYLIAIPLGIAKAVRNGSRFDFISSIIVIIAYAVPSFLFALALITLFAGGGLFELFPLRGISSIGYENFSLFEKITDYFWHLALPLTAMTLSGFAKLTLLTKNSFLEEINKQYVLTARSKGVSMNNVLYKHIFKNAMLIVISSAPTTLIAVLFTSSLLIEVLFSLDGLGLLGFESALNRDYPIMFGSLYLYTLIGMALHLIGDFFLMTIDKRINMSKNR